MSKKIKLISVFIISAFLMTSLMLEAYAASSVEISVNGKAIDLGAAQPYIYESTVMLPVRAMSEALGASVTWDGVHQKAYMLRGYNLSFVKKGICRINIDGAYSPLSVTPQIKNGSMYLPLEYVEDVFDCKTFYNSYTSTLSITMTDLPVHFATGFRIKYVGNGCKLVTDGENFRLLLVPRGKTAPKGVVADKTISIPLENVLTLSSTFVGSMEKLGVLDSVKAVTTSKDFWYIPEIKEAMENGEIEYVGGDNMEPPNYEIVKSINPELTFVYTGDVGQRHIMRKFDAMGIRYAVNNEYLETNYLGRMEWIKFIAAFYDKELEAEKMFNDTVKNINRTKGKVAGTTKPKVAWGLSWMGKVYVANPDSYVGRWITECRGDYVFKDIGRGSDTQVSMEDFYAYAKDADILIFSSTTNYMKDPTIRGIIKDNPLFANIKAVKDGEVWAYAPDWWQTIPETDDVVEDIAAIFHPEKFAGHKVTKLVKLPRN